MKNHCDICGRIEDKQQYHTACLRRMFGTADLPVIQLRRSEIVGLAQEMAGKLSVSGVQPKLSVLRRGSKLIPAVTGGQFILKPQTEQYPCLPENENLCMTIAGLLEIEVPHHGLFSLLDGSSAYVVRRFDRQKDGGKMRCEDFAQILGEEEKYSGSMEQIGKKIAEISSVPGLDVQFFFERVLLNFLLGNGDAHLKNYSMLESEDGLRFSPAYDIVCSKAVLPKEWDSALALNGKKNKIGREDFDYLVEYLKIPNKAARDIFVKFKNSQTMILDQIDHSKLSKNFKASVCRIVNERYKRVFMTN